MEVTPIDPFGARVTGFDLRRENHPALLWDLVVKYGVVIMPGYGFPEDAPQFYEKKNVSKLAKAMGYVPEYHPTNYFGDDGVQELATLGDGDRKPDAYLYHTDTSWVVQPSQVGMLTAKMIPTSGGNTLFVSSATIYNTLPRELQAKLHHLSAWHSYRTFYKRLDSSIKFKSDGDDGAVHPAIIQHPFHGYPILYVNPNSTSHFLDLPIDESGCIIERLTESINNPNLPCVEHSWSRGDVVLWDDIAMQHLARRDYNSRRIMMRSHSAKFGYRTERFMPSGVKINFMDLLSSSIPFSKEQVIYYDSLAKESGYRIPTVASQMVTEKIKFYECSEGKKEMKILDVGGGTGQFGHEMVLRKWEEKLSCSCDFVDASKLMRQEAERKEVYETCYTQDVNKSGLMFSKENQYFGVVCLFSIGPQQIQFSKIISEARRVVFDGGFIFFVAFHGLEKIIHTIHEHGLSISKQQPMYMNGEEDNNDFENESFLVICEVGKK